MSISGGYRVVFEEYARRHYIKSFEKDYKGAWLATRKAIVGALKNVDMLRDSGRLSNPPLHYSADRREWILKQDFAIAGRHESPHGSGRRIIAYVNENERVVRVLMVYHKKHIDGAYGSETAWWESVVKAEYGEMLGNIEM